MIWAAFTIGLMGSLHCVGMCGPIAFALPVGQHSRWQKLVNALLYNLGRTTTYALLGLIIGLLGKGLFLAGIQKHLSIFAGVSLLLIVLFSINIEHQLVSIPSFSRFFLLVKSKLGKLLRNPSRTSIFFIGLTNGLLPCGLVYLALVGALTLGSIQSSVWYMIFFGLGTIPLMLVATLASNSFSLSIKKGLKKAYPMVMVCIGGWLIYRGVYFDVPANFSFWEMMQDMPMCH